MEPSVSRAVPGAADPSPGTPPEAAAQAAFKYKEEFVIGPDMSIARVAHSSTLLKDGTVLVAGGMTAAGSPAAWSATLSAELYRPDTNTFEPIAGSMVLPQGYHTANALEDGRVLLVGGHDGTRNVSTRQIFDPAAKSFSAVSACKDESGSAVTCPRRYNHSATLLKSGKVLIVGGYVTGSSLGDSAEVFDPSTGIFTQLSAKLPAALGYHASARLPNGDVLLAGGLEKTGGSLVASRRVTIYDPSLGAHGGFKAGSDLNQPRWNYNNVATSALLANSKLFLTGGSAATSGVPILAPELYGSGGGPSGSIACASCAARIGNTLSPLKDGRILSLGGGDHAGVSLATADVYDATPGTGKGGIAMRAARNGGAATLLDSGRVLVTGGLGGANLPIRGSEFFQ